MTKEDIAYLWNDVDSEAHAEVCDNEIIANGTKISTTEVLFGKHNGKDVRRSAYVFSVPEKLVNADHPFYFACIEGSFDFYFSIEPENVLIFNFARDGEETVMDCWDSEGEIPEWAMKDVFSDK